jgi:hypothetical protein
MMTHKRVIAAVTGAALLVVAGAAVGLSAPDPAPQLIQSYHASGPIYESLDELTNKSVLVAEVRAVAVGPSYIVAPDKPVKAAPATGPHIPQGGPNGKGTTTPPPVPDPAPGVPASAGGKLLQTDVTVEVVEILRGAGVQQGQRLVVAQLGGKDQHGNNVLTEGDSVMSVGDHEILFLKRAPSGKYYTTGGGQGRFAIHADGTVTAIDPQSRVRRLYDGKPASFLKSSVEAVH